MTERARQPVANVRARLSGAAMLRALAVVLPLLLLLAGNARAELPPAPDQPPYSPYAQWYADRQHRLDGWIRGVGPAQWLPPVVDRHGREPYWVDELRVLPESGLVLWLRRPAVLDQMRPLSSGEDHYGRQLADEWPQAVQRDVLVWQDWFDREIAARRLALLREKAAQTARELKQEQARGSLIDINIPLNLPKSVERVVGRGEKSNITVTGRETITLSGETTRNSNFITDESGRGQPLFPRLEMKQELQVKLNGTVGEKVHVEVENNSLAQGADANRIRIRYEGDEDEVVELIEMGDTQLSLPSSGLISYSTQNKGLFGVKMQGHLGALDFTAIASKQEGEVSSKTFNNSGQDVRADSKRDTDYIANRFFFLDNPTDPDSFYRWIVEEKLQVFVSNGAAPSASSPDASRYYWGRAYTDLGGNGLADDLAGQSPELEAFKLLQENEYTWRVDPNGNFSILELNYPIAETDILAVSYTARDSANGDALRQVGDNTQGKITYFDSQADTLSLELIKPDPYRPDSPTWDYMLRNVYSLGGTEIDFASLEVSIERIGTSQDPAYPEGSNTPYLRFFGLDQYRGQLVEGFDPDGRIDWPRIDIAEGLLIFPYYRPFDPPEGLVCQWTQPVVGDCELLTDADLNPAIYETARETINRNPSLYSKYVIKYQSATVASRFNLNAFDILEGSEVVTLDGVPLKKGTDYRIDYFSGEVELLGDAAARLTPSSNLQVTYQFRPLVGGGQSSLVGFNGTYHLGEKNQIASSWLYESKYSGARRPRLGEESTRNVVGNVLANLSAEPEFLTSFANLLPRVDTDATSTVSLSSELAVSFPNPNVDNEAFVDDMEGAEDAVELGVNRVQWVRASEPVDAIRVVGGADILPTPAGRARGAYWFKPQGTTRREDFNLNLPEQEAQEVVDVLQLFVPVNLNAQQLGAYPALVETDGYNRAQGDSLWMGLMRGFSGQGLDLSEAQYLEVWVNDFQQQQLFRTGRLHFDMGAINEDYWNPELNEYDTEDREGIGVFVQGEEDTGLDGVFDMDEPPDPDNPYGGAADPAGDDYAPEQQDEDFGSSYFRINGTESNQRLDTEDLDGDGTLDQTNSYFTLTVDLNAVPFTDMVEVYADEGVAPPENNKAWRLYRINLDEARVVGDGFQAPDWSRINYFRFWVDGLNAPGQNPERPSNRLEVASIKLVGNRWKTHGIQELATGVTLPPTSLSAGEDLRVEVINSKDNANFSWPFGEQLDPDTGLPEREQALNVVYENLQPGHQALIRKDYQSLNLTGYRTLTFYVHPDQASADHDVFLRAAQDSTTYYEWRYRPQSQGWTEVNLDLQDWTDLKLISDADTVRTAGEDAVFPGRDYTLTRIGNPDLSRIRAFFFGIVNDEGALPLTGETWVNDLKVKEVKRATGYAGKVTGSVNMAGVLNMGVNYQEQDAEFRGLRATTGQGAHTRNWSVSASSALEHFVPLGGYKLPINASYGRGLSLPKYQLSSDVELDRPHQEEQKSTSINQRVSASLSRSPSTHLLGRLLFDKIKLSGSVTQRRSNTPLRLELQEQLAYGASYDTQIKDRRLPIFGLGQLRYLPGSLRLKSDVTRSRTESWKASGLRYTPNPYISSGKLTNSANLNWPLFDSFKTDFGINDARDLEHEDPDALKLFGKSLNIGYQTSQGQTLRIDFTLPYLRRFRPKFSFNSNYSQSAQAVNLGSNSVAAGSKNLNNSNVISTTYNFEVGKWFTWMGGEGLEALRKAKAPEETPGRSAGPTGAPRHQPQRLLVPVDPLRGPDPRMRRRSTRRFIEDELEVAVPAAAAEADSTEKQVDPMFIVYKTLDVLSGLKPLKVDLSRRVNTRFDNVHGAPTLLYRLGFSEDPDLPGTQGGVAVDHKRADLLDESRDLRLATGVTVAENLQVSTDFEYTRGTRKMTSTSTVDTNRKWPSLSVDLSGVEKWPLWGDMLESSSLGLGYGRQLRVTENLVQGTENRTQSTNWTPRWSMNWANKMQTQLTGSYGSTASIENTSQTKSSNLKVDLSWNYNLSAPNGLGFPGLGKIRFSSRMDLNAKLGYTRIRNVRIDSGGFETPLGGSKSFTISPGASYQFTEKLRGSAGLTFSRTSDDIRNNVQTRVRLDLRTTFVF
ncbi:MAG: cell surface protein SprA [Candidatus Krumholzibacteriia bacterium]|nr:cell surface protein SprA [Candidatus Latescibacterota bacterium]MCB9514713.1 cell surface protein SprA [Candidatus Latescibacterota bacterium]